MEKRKEASRGGARVGSGRKQIGETRRMSLALPDKVWAWIDNESKGSKVGAIIRRELIEVYENKNKNERNGC